MKHIKPLNTFINEKINYGSNTINGKEVVSSWIGSADNERDFIKMIDAIPETLQSITVQTGTSNFNPAREDFKGPINASTKKKIIKIIKDVTKAYKKEGDDIVEYELKSYFGVSPKGNLTDPAYIQYRTKNNIQFANDMAAGKYGRLD